METTRPKSHFMQAGVDDLILLSSNANAFSHTVGATVKRGQLCDCSIWMVDLRKLSHWNLTFLQAVRIGASER